MIWMVKDHEPPKKIMVASGYDSVMVVMCTLEMHSVKLDPTNGEGKTCHKSYITPTQFLMHAEGTSQDLMLLPGQADANIGS
jgi:hypothetical protein